MMQILHLVETSADFQTRAGVDALARHPTPSLQASVRTLGPGGSDRGVLAAVRALKRLRPRPSLIQAWGLQALAAAALGASEPIVFSPVGTITRRAIHWLRAIMAYRDVRVVLPTATQQRFVLENGLPPERCHLIRPGVNFGRLPRRKDPDLRAALGLDAHDRILLVPGESTARSGHCEAVWAASMLHVLDPRCKLLIWGRGSAVAAVGRFARHMGYPDLLCVAEERLGRPIDFETLLSAADMAIIAASNYTDALPVAICMAGRLPIVATVSSTIGELLEDRHTALLVGKPSPRLLARRVTELWEDPGLAWRISDTARTEAYEFHSLTRFLDQHRALYARESP